MCCVDVQALRQAADLTAPLPAFSYVDMPTRKSAQAYISHYASADEVQARLWVTGHAHRVCEVLVAWRGALPRDIFRIVDPDSGQFVRMLDPAVPGLEFTVYSSRCSRQHRSINTVMITVRPRSLQYLQYYKYSTVLLRVLLLQYEYSTTVAQAKA